MDKNYIKRIINLMRTDLITMNGGKGNLKSVAVIMLLLFGLMGFTISPLAGIYTPMMLSFFFVPMLFQNESKYHSEKMFALLPINRKDLVRSRFILCIGIYTIVCMIFYLLMLLSMQFKIYNYINGEFDVLEVMAKNFGEGFTPLEMFNLSYFSVFSLCLIFLSNSLRKYFKDSKKITEQLSVHKASKQEYFIAILAFVIIILIVMVVSGILPLDSALVVILLLIKQIAGTLNGVLLGIVLLAIAVMATIYRYICTILEYDEKEL